MIFAVSLRLVISNRNLGKDIYSGIRLFEERYCVNSLTTLQIYCSRMVTKTH